MTIPRRFHGIFQHRRKYLWITLSTTWPGFSRHRCRGGRCFASSAASWREALSLLSGSSRWTPPPAPKHNWVRGQRPVDKAGTRRAVRQTRAAQTTAPPGPSAVRAASVSAPTADARPPVAGNAEAAVLCATGSPSVVRYAVGSRAGWTLVQSRDTTAS